MRSVGNITITINYKLKWCLIFLVYFIVSYGCRPKKESISESTSEKNRYGIANFYEKTQIGNQIWFTKDLDEVTFQNGDSLEQLHTAKDWNNAIRLKMPGYAVIGEDVVVYNWFAVIDARKLAPKGYHIPSDEEWTELVMNLEADNKEKKNTTNNFLGFWNYNLGSGIVFPNGKKTMLDRNSKYRITRFTGITKLFWSTTELSDDDVWCRRINNELGDYKVALSKEFGLAVRCVKDTKD